MYSHQSPDTDVTVEIENIGGIDRRELEFAPGVTVLAGTNATNRTSMLRALVAACGSDRAYLKADAAEGRVALSLGDETYTRTFRRTDQEVTTGGNPLLTDESHVEAADKFAFLLADNEARRAVLDPETNLRDVVMAPVDTSAIEDQIEQIQAELDAVDDAIDRRDTLESETLPELEAEREELRTEVETLESRIQETEEELEAADEDVETSKEQRERIDLLTADLGTARDERRRVDRRIAGEEEALDEAREEYESVQEELDELDTDADTDRAALEADLAELRNQRADLNEKINTLTTIISFNEERLTGESTVSQAVAAALGESPAASAGRDRSAEELTQQLTEPTDGEETVRCWTCGQEAAESQIQATISALREEVENRRAKRSEVEDEIQTVEAEIDSFEEKQQQRRRLEQQAQSLEDTIERTEDRLSSLAEQREEAAERVSELEAQMADLETSDETYNRVVELHSEITELETEKRQAEENLEAVEDEIADVRDELDELAGIEEQRDELRAELEHQRNRIETIRSEVVESFNENMDTLLEKLAYENIERVWLERRQEDVRSGRRKVTETVFDLHVVRGTEDGTVYEDTRGIQHLSESERNVVGLVFALAGYLAHDVYETVPFMLLDSLEAIDSARISTLVEHFSQYADYLVTALLHEDCEPLLTEVEPATVVRVDDPDS